MNVVVLPTKPQAIQKTNLLHLCQTGFTIAEFR